MADPRSELEELRRLDELEKKAAGGYIPPEAKTSVRKAAAVTPEVKERVRSLSERAGEYLFGEPEREEFSGGEVAGAAGVGAGVGVVGPKVLQKGGALVKKLPLPYARPIGTAAEALGTVWGKMPASVRALQGGGGGAAASATEQAVEMAGAPRAVSIPAGFAVGGVTPELGNAIKKLVTKAGSAVFGTEGMTSAIMRDLRSQGVEITPKVAELIEKEVNAFRQAPKGKEPQESIYDALKLGATDITKTAEQLARETAQKGAEAMTEAERRAGKMSAAAEKTTEIGQKALSEAQAARSQIGTPRDDSAVGTSIREKIMSMFGDIAKTRSSAYAAQKKLRDDVVSQKESAGQLVKDLPEYQQLLTDLRGKLLIGKTAQEAKTAPVTEKGVLQAYQNIYDAVNQRRVMIGVDTNGNPAYKTFPTSFDALDDVRRRLGDVAFGKEVEGYSAIGADIARTYYAKLSDIQSKFAGEAHDALQANYEMASRLLDKYKSRAGKKATAADRFDPTRFNTDPASLPRDYFNSKQSVNDLLELTGNDRAFVVKEASDFVSRQLGSSNLQTAKAAKDWVYKNESWLKELPEVKSKVDSYIRGLERGERVAEKSKKAASTLVPMEKATIREGERALADARAAGEKITKEAESRVKTILGSQFPNEEVEKLMLSGDLSRWSEVAPILARSETGRASMEKAVRQVMSRVSPRNMGDVFRDNVRQRLETTKIIPARTLDVMQADLDYISGLTISPEQKMSLLSRVLKNVFTTIPATTVGAPVGGLAGSLTED